MAKIDLDAARAARREATASTPTPTVLFGGREFALPPEIPFGVFVSLATMRDDPEQGPALVVDLLNALLGEEAAEAFVALGPSMDDVENLVKGVLAEYGMDSGESSASPVS